jgi:hypothetical protein
MSGNGRVTAGKRLLEPALIVEKYFARVKKPTFEMGATGQIAAQ